MARADHKAKWYAAMRKRLGVTTNAEVRAWMKKQGSKAKRTGTGGFAHLKENDPEKLKQLSKDAISKRWANRG